MTKDWLAILNPSSGLSQGKDRCGKALAALDNVQLSYDSVYTEKHEDGIKLAKQKIEEGYRKLIIVGGDGTINEVANGVFLQKAVPTREITIGIMPIGTGNDFVRALNIPADLQKAANLIKIGTPKLIDAGKVVSQFDDGPRNRYFVNVAGIGFDASVVHTANKGKAASGKWTYLWALLSSLWSYKLSTIKVTIDDKPPLEGKMFSVNVANCNYAGGGMMVSAEAIPDDGLFEIVTIGDIAKPAIVWHVPKLYKGEINKIKEIDAYQGKKVIVTAEPDVYVEAEGELFGKTPIEIEMLESSFNIIKP